MLSPDNARDGWPRRCRRASISMWCSLSERIDRRSTIIPAVSEWRGEPGLGSGMVSSVHSSIRSAASLRRWLKPSMARLASRIRSAGRSSRRAKSSSCQRSKFIRWFSSMEAQDSSGSGKWGFHARAWSIGSGAQRFRPPVRQAQSCSLKRRHRTGFPHTFCKN